MLQSNIEKLSDIKMQQLEFDSQFEQRVRIQTHELNMKREMMLMEEDAAEKELEHQIQEWRYHCAGARILPSTTTDA